MNAVKKIWCYLSKALVLLIFLMLCAMASVLRAYESVYNVQNIEEYTELSKYLGTSVEGEVARANIVLGFVQYGPYLEYLIYFMVLVFIVYIARRKKVKR